MAFYWGDAEAAYICLPHLPVEGGGQLLINQHDPLGAAPSTNLDNAGVWGWQGSALGRYKDNPP